MTRSKRTLLNVWAVVSVILLLGLTLYALYYEWTEDLTRKQMFMMYFKYMGTLVLYYHREHTIV
ncbi:MAG: hypothetical protein P8J32_03045, partial [bacterium]|nr:hypothetical protein [bacterium]